DHLAPRPDLQAPRDLRRRRNFGSAEELTSRVAVEAGDVLRKPGAPGDSIIDDVLLHEGAAALLDPQETGVLQRRHGAPERVPVDAEAVGQLRLGWQAFARLEGAGGDLGLQGLLDPAPQRHAGAVDRVRFHVTLSRKKTFSFCRFTIGTLLAQDHLITYRHIDV